MSIFTLPRQYTRPLTYGFIVVLIGVLVLIHSFRADAEVALFDPQFIIENILPSEEDPSYIESEHIWSSFEGTVPEGATVDSIMLTLSWEKVAIDEREEEKRENGATAVEGSDGVVIGEGGTATQETPAESVVPNAVTEPEPVPTEEEVAEEETPMPADEVSPQPEDQSEESDVVETPSDAPTTSSSPATEESAFIGFPRISSHDAQLLVQAESVATAEEISPEAEIVVGESTAIETHEVPVKESEPVLQEEGVIVEEISPDEILPEITEEPEYVPEVVSAEYSTTSAPAYPPPSSARVEYSFDGEVWMKLETLNLLDTNIATIDVSMVAPESVSSLRIRVRYRTSSLEPKIQFQNPQLALTYSPPEVVIAPLGPSDQEPNFLVSSIKNEVTNGAVRVVFLERGGLFELWSAVSDTYRGTIAWSKLASGSTLDGGTHIEVHGRTVFWFVPSIKTLFGYDVDVASLMSAGVEVGQEQVVTLRYGTGTYPWIATYDMHLNEFTFVRISKSSL